jgi:hypothetical protein
LSEEERLRKVDADKIMKLGESVRKYKEILRSKNVDPDDIPSSSRLRDELKKKQLECSEHEKNIATLKHAVSSERRKTKQFQRQHDVGMAEKAAEIEKLDDLVKEKDKECRLLQVQLKVCKGKQGKKRHSFVTFDRHLWLKLFFFHSTLMIIAECHSKSTSTSTWSKGRSICEPRAIKFSTNTQSV